MPFFELSLLLRPMPRQEMVECLKRTAQLIWNEKGALRKIDYLGTRKLPYAAWGKEERTKVYEGSYFVYHLSLEQQRFKAIKPELKLDNDILISNLFFANEAKVPEDYECTLEEELLPPSYRPSVQPMFESKNVRADVRRAHSIRYQKAKLIG